MTLADVAVVAATVAIVMVLVVWLVAGQAIRRRRPDPTNEPEGHPWQPVSFTSRDGIALRGRLIGDAPTRPTVVFCPGLFGSMDGDTPMVPLFADAGFNVFQFDWRGHGASAGQRVTLGVREIEDLRGALDYLQAQGVRCIGLMGFSMGAAVALRVAAADERVTCVAVDGPPLSMPHTVNNAIRSRIGIPLPPLTWLLARFIEVRGGINLSEASPLPVVGKISPRPVLMVHGGADPLVSRADQERLYAACNHPKTLWQIEGAGHREAFAKRPAAYKERVVGFFEAHLLG